MQSDRKITSKILKGYRGNLNKDLSWKVCREMPRLKANDGKKSERCNERQFISANKWYLSSSFSVTHSKTKTSYAGSH